MLNQRNRTFRRVGEGLRVWIRRFSPTEYQPPPYGSPDPWQNKLSGGLPLDNLSTDRSPTALDNFCLTVYLQVDLLMSPSQGLSAYVPDLLSQRVCP